MPPTPPPPVPELIAQAGQRLLELGDRAAQLAATGANCCHNVHIEQALDLAKQVLEIPSPVR